MKYKTLLIGAITLAAMSLANANIDGVDSSKGIFLKTSSKSNHNGPLNTRYGTVEFKNLTPDTDYIIEADDKKSKDGTFLIRNPIIVKPGETANLEFAMNWGENAAMDAEADVHCESTGSASATLFIGGAASGHYHLEASCEAVARLTQKAYVGIAPTSHPIAKVLAVVHHKTKDDCVVKLRGGYIGVNPITYAAANAHQNFAMAVADGDIQWEGKTYKGYVTNNHFEPAALQIDQPTVNVYSPSWEKSVIRRCAANRQ